MKCDKIYSKVIRIGVDQEWNFSCWYLCQTPLNSLWLLHVAHGISIFMIKRKRYFYSNVSLEQQISATALIYN